jgi:hypothetical protein
VAGRRTRIYREHCGRHLADIDDSDAETIVLVKFGPTLTPPRGALGSSRRSRPSGSTTTHRSTLRPRTTAGSTRPCSSQASSSGIAGPADARPVGPRARDGGVGSAGTGRVPPPLPAESAGRDRAETRGLRQIGGIKPSSPPIQSVNSSDSTLICAVQRRGRPRTTRSLTAALPEPPRVLGTAGHSRARPGYLGERRRPAWRPEKLLGCLPGGSRRSRATNVDFGMRAPSAPGGCAAPVARRRVEAFLAPGYAAGTQLREQASERRLMGHHLPNEPNPATPGAGSAPNRHQRAGFGGRTDPACSADWAHTRGAPLP